MRILDDNGFKMLKLSFTANKGIPHEFATTELMGYFSNTPGLPAAPSSSSSEDEQNALLSVHLWQMEPGPGGFYLNWELDVTDAEELKLLEELAVNEFIILDDEFGYGGSLVKEYTSLDEVHQDYPFISFPQSVGDYELSAVRVTVWGSQAEDPPKTNTVYRFELSLDSVSRIKLVYQNQDKAMEVIADSPLQNFSDHLKHYPEKTKLGEHEYIVKNDIGYMMYLYESEGFPITLRYGTLLKTSDAMTGTTVLIDSQLTAERLKELARPFTESFYVSCK